MGTRPASALIRRGTAYVPGTRPGPTAALPDASFLRQHQCAWGPLCALLLINPHPFPPPPRRPLFPPSSSAASFTSCIPKQTFGLCRNHLAQPRSRHRLFASSPLILAAPSRTNRKSQTSEAPFLLGLTLRIILTLQNPFPTVPDNLRVYVHRKSQSQRFVSHFFFSSASASFSARLSPSSPLSRAPLSPALVIAGPAITRTVAALAISRPALVLHADLCASIDPFADADEDTGETKQAQNYIHIRIQRKPLHFDRDQPGLARIGLEPADSSIRA